MFTSLRLGRTLNPTAITESDPYWSCCLGNAPLRLILETPQKKYIYNNNNNNVKYQKCVQQMMNHRHTHSLFNQRNMSGRKKIPTTRNCAVAFLMS